MRSFLWVVLVFAVTAIGGSPSLAQRGGTAVPASIAATSPLGAGFTAGSPMGASGYDLGSGSPVPCSGSPSNTAAMSPFDGGGMMIPSSSPDDDVVVGSLGRAGTNFFDVDPDHGRNERRFGSLWCCTTEHLGFRLGLLAIKFDRGDKR